MTELRSNIQQLIVLTHNTQFHHEASYTSDESDSRHYYRLQKTKEGLTIVQCDGKHCRVRGNYLLLWDFVVQAARTRGESELVQVGIFNTVRRIIEWYFKIIGIKKDLREIEGLSVSDQQVLSMFDIWANSGSHTTVDDIDQTMGTWEVQRFLQLFQAYFSAQGHAAHFNMMVAKSEGKSLLSEGELFSLSKSRLGSLNAVPEN